MKALPNLGAIVDRGDGCDTMDVDAARRLGIGVSNTPDVLNDTVADTAVGLILATMRGLCAADRHVRAGRWPLDGNYPLGRDLSGSRVGIVGLGRIGAAIATRLVGFGCAIAYHSRREVADSPYRYLASPVALAEAVDVLVIATVGGAGTKNLVSRAVLEALGPDGMSSILRGEASLIRMPSSNCLPGDGWRGPDWMSSPTNLMYQRNYSDWTMCCCCHTSVETVRSLSRMGELVLRNLDQYLTHGTLTTPIVSPNRPFARS
jgi:D-isomer specific 2-hydroxyacid dehydrogenase, NAD binding domain/D-isomer specific 2-hydroxyacid dehydrogenase, catalytic domain